VCPEEEKRMKYWPVETGEPVISVPFQEKVMIPEEKRGIEYEYILWPMMLKTETSRDAGFPVGKRAMKEVLLLKGFG